METLPAAPEAPVPYVPFAARCPELARTETRSVTVLPEAHDLDLPPGTYSFLELFCDERSCDCRRVFLLVEASFRPGPEAVIAWGWEPREYYERWSHESDPFAIDQLKGPALNLMATKLGVGPFGGRDLSCGRAC